MKREDVFKKVQDFFVEKGWPEHDITEKSNLSTDFDLDSLDNVEFIMELEKIFNIAIPDEEAEKYFDNNTLKDVIDYLMLKIK